MPNNLSLRPLADADIPRMADWLQKPYILKWYHDPEDWLAEIRGRADAFSWIHHFIVLDGERPIGFCQYYDCFDAGDLEDWYEAPSRGETFSIDYLIGEEEYLGKGYGKAIVRLLEDRIRQQGAKRIIVQPDKENHASNGVLEANGYAFDAERDYYIKML